METIAAMSTSSNPQFPSTLQETLAKYQIIDSHLPADEAASPWIPYGGDNIYARYLSFDTRLGQTHTLLRSSCSGSLGRHKHRSPVNAFTLAGSWGYREYDWVARPGDLVQESPGAIHTLYTDNEEGFSAYFIVNGAVEYYDESDNIVDMHDVFWFVDHYLNHCRANGLAPNPALFRC
jgi:2,4'-dihydroxyacetophenone dioxygenase